MANSHQMSSMQHVNHSEEWVLQRVGHPDTVFRLNSSKQQFTIGRAGNADLICPGKTVSRLHCIVKFDGGVWKITDLKSVNGVFINRSQIQPSVPMTLHDLDVLGIGALDANGSDYYLFIVKKTNADTNKAKSDGDDDDDDVVFIGEKKDVNRSSNGKSKVSSTALNETTTNVDESPSGGIATSVSPIIGAAATSAVKNRKTKENNISISDNNSCPESNSSLKDPVVKQEKLPCSLAEKEVVSSKEDNNLLDKRNPSLDPNLNNMAINKQPELASHSNADSSLTSSKEKIVTKECSVVLERMDPIILSKFLSKAKEGSRKSSRENDSDSDSAPKIKVKTIRGRRIISDSDSEDDQLSNVTKSSFDENSISFTQDHSESSATLSRVSNTDDGTKNDTIPSLRLSDHSSGSATAASLSAVVDRNIEKVVPDKISKTSTIEAIRKPPSIGKSNLSANCDSGKSSAAQLLKDTDSSKKTVNNTGSSIPRTSNNLFPSSAENKGFTSKTPMVVIKSEPPDRQSPPPGSSLLTINNSHQELLRSCRPSDPAPSSRASITSNNLNPVPASPHTSSSIRRGDAHGKNNLSLEVNDSCLLVKNTSNHNCDKENTGQIPARVLGRNPSVESESTSQSDSDSERNRVFEENLSYSQNVDVEDDIGDMDQIEINESTIVKSEVSIGPVDDGAEYFSDDDIFVYDYETEKIPQPILIKKEPAEAEEPKENNDELELWLPSLSQSFGQAPVPSRERHIVSHSSSSNTEETATTSESRPLRNASTGSEEQEDGNEWWPQLSQAFSDEIEQELEQEREAGKEDKTKKLEKLLSSQSQMKRFTSNANKTKLTEALPIQPPKRGRFSLATASSPPRDNARPSTSSNEKHSTTNFYGKKQDGHSISRIRKDPRKSIKKKGLSTREKLKKNCGLVGYTASIKAGAVTPPEIAVIATKPVGHPTPKTVIPKESHPKKSTTVPRIERTTNAPAKVKVTSKNRGAFLTEENPVKSFTGEPRKRAADKETFTIPKKRKEDNITNETSVPLDPANRTEDYSRVLTSPETGQKVSIVNRNAVVEKKQHTGVLKNFSSGHESSDPKGENRSGNKEKRSIRFADKDDVHLIPPRSCTPNERNDSYPSVDQNNSVSQPISSRMLRNNMLLRILKWNYRWIAEQQKSSTPPPLLDLIPGNLPKLMCIPVVSSYPNLETYFSVFHPLMLHEQWAVLCKDVLESENGPLSWDLMFSDFKREDGSFILLRCSTAVENESLAPSHSDLVALDLWANNQPFHPLAVVENPNISKIPRNNNLDYRLFKFRPKATLLVNFTIRIRKSCEKAVSSFCKGTKLTSLRTLLKQFQVHAGLYQSPLRETILKPHESAFCLKECSKPLTDGFNQSQHKAICSIVDTIMTADSKEPKIALLQGPPGTGKTEVISSMVIQMLYNYRRGNAFPRLLICAPSNAAVDEIVRRLMEARQKIDMHNRFKLLRVGVYDSMHPNVREVSLDGILNRAVQKINGQQQGSTNDTIKALQVEVFSLEQTITQLREKREKCVEKKDMDEAGMLGRKIEELLRQLDSYRMSLANAKSASMNSLRTERHDRKCKIIAEADVIATTLNSCYSGPMENVFVRSEGQRPLWCCIVDEASQCTEPESLMPLAFGINKLVLVGDPQQLPATVCSPVAKKYRFDQSFFNRLYSFLSSNVNANRQSVMMLDTQYRMHPEICKWPSKYFYGGKLLTPKKLDRESSFHPYRVLNVIDSQEHSHQKETGNNAEAILVAKLAQGILQSPHSQGKSIGIITFYRRQKHLIQKKLLESSCPKNNIVVNTVDAFQGQEKDIIIISSVRAKNANNKIGFLGFTQRLNVAITRAKYSLILCGHFDSLKTNRAWNNLIKDANERNVTHVVTSSHDVNSLLRLTLKENQM